MDLEMEMRFWRQVVEDSKRTVVCHPSMEVRARAAVADLGMAAIIKIVASPVCPEGTMYSIDERGLEAALNEVLAKPIRLSGLWPEAQ